MICSDCIKTLRQADSLDITINENQRLHFEKRRSLKVPAKKILKKNQEKLKPKSGLESFRCERCDKEFDTKIQLKKHKKNIHEAKTFKCNFCEFSTKIAINVIEHIANHLNPLKKYVRKKEQKYFEKYEDSKVILSCTLCQEVLTSISELKNHLLDEHLTRLKLHCDHCDYRCFKKCQMIDHITCKHVLKSCKNLFDKERKYECTFEGCLRRFKVPLLLKQHMSLVHSGEF